jgi:hypothetical protein
VRTRTLGGCFDVLQGQLGNKNLKVCITVQTFTFFVSSMECANCFSSDTKAQKKILDANLAWRPAISQLFFPVL